MLECFPQEGVERPPVLSERVFLRRSEVRAAAWSSKRERPSEGSFKQNVYAAFGIKEETAAFIMRQPF